jgi:hypothetical protein
MASIELSAYFTFKEYEIPGSLEVGENVEDGSGIGGSLYVRAVKPDLFRILIEDSQDSAFYWVNSETLKKIGDGYRIDLDKPPVGEEEILDKVV